MSAIYKNMFTTPAEVATVTNNIGATTKEVAKNFFFEMQQLMMDYATPGKPVTIYGKTFTTDTEKNSLLATTSFNLYTQDYSNILDMIFNLQNVMFNMEKQVASFSKGA